MTSTALEALRLSSDAVQVFSRLHHQMRSQPLLAEETLEEWTSYVRSVEPRTRVAMENGATDTSLGDSLSTLSRILHELSQAVMESMGNASLEGTLSNSFSTLSGVRGPRVGGLRGLPSKHKSGSGSPPAGSTVRSDDQNVLATISSPTANRAPTQKDLEGGLADSECTGFLLE